MALSQHFGPLSTCVTLEYFCWNLLLPWDEAEAYCWANYSEWNPLHLAAGNAILRRWIGFQHVKKKWLWGLQNTKRA